MTEEKKETFKEISTLKRVNAAIQVVSALLANAAAALGWARKYFHLFPLESGQGGIGIAFSISMSVLGILLLWRWALDPSRNMPPSQRFSLLIKAAAYSLVGFFFMAAAYHLLDSLWKISSIPLAEIITALAMPFVYGLGHALLSTFLCGLGLATLAPGIGILSRSSSTANQEAANAEIESK